MTINRTKGFSLIELVVYIAVLSILMVVVVQALLGISSSYSHIALKRSIEESAMTTLERISREIRNAHNGSAGASLSLSSTEGGTTVTREFFVDGNQTLRLRENGVDRGPLTKSGIRVTTFSASLMSTSTSKAVKIDLALEATRGEVTEADIFHTTVVMRGVY